MPLSSSQHENEDCAHSCARAKLQRRDFLFGAGATLVAISMPGSLGASMQARVAEYPSKRIAQLSRLGKGERVTFRYPWDHENCDSVLVRLDRPAAGGIGTAQDIVAFNALCTHMGESMPATLFTVSTGVAGPCPWHWTTFDLTRHGMVVSGHATQGLPQVLLRAEGDHIFAVGVLGLMFGFHDNRADPNRPGGA